MKDDLLYTCQYCGTEKTYKWFVDIYKFCPNCFLFYDKPNSWYTRRFNKIKYFWLT